MANTPSIIIEFPVLDALCNHITRKSAGLWFYLLVRGSEMPLKCRDVIKEYGITKSFFYTCIRDLEKYNLCFVKNGKVYFYHQQLAFKREKEYLDMAAKAFTKFGEYGHKEGSTFNKRTYGLEDEESTV